MVFDPSACQFVKEEQSEGEEILSTEEKIRRNVPDLSGQNSEDKTASSPLVQGPVNQSRDLDSRALDDSSISSGMGGLLTAAKLALRVPSRMACLSINSPKILPSMWPSMDNDTVSIPSSKDKDR